VTNDLDIETDIFYKTTDTKQYLSYDSCHPRHTKNAVPYNLARRICTIVSNIPIKNERLKELEAFLIRRKYTLQIINHGIENAKKQPQEILRKVKIKEESNILPFITRHNPNRENDFGKVKMIMDYIKETPSLNEIYNNTKIIHSKRQPSNLKNILCRAAFTMNDKTSVKKCNKPRCTLCKIIIEGDKFTFPTIKWDFKVTSNMSCETLNCLYVLTCGGCQEIYIGETNNLRLRTNLHRDHITNNSGLYVSKHIHDCASKKENKFRIMPFYKIRRDDTGLRKQKEEHFIKKCSPNLNVQAM
jgi:hypothetical protein